jgi:hypothetical protein
MSPDIDWPQEALHKSEDMRALAMEAGRQILSVYSRDFEVTEESRHLTPHRRRYGFSSRHN